MKNSNLPDAAALEKRQNRYLFTCIANILYVIPCLCCLGMGILTDGFTPAYIFAIVTVLLALPAAFFALFAYKQKKFRGIVILINTVVMVCHVGVCLLIGAWYVILSPAFLLLALMIAFSGIITEH